MKDAPIIRIVVSCHTDSVRPKSDLFVPVQVGASLAAKSLKGTVPDNKGENISHRNSSFCELTAQYWAWKNMDADYVGLCHYRRFFCFDGKDHIKNDHAQIEIPCLSERSVNEYCLDDEELITAVVLQHDLIIPEKWDVKCVPTPLGPQPTVGKHMMAYGLVDQDALNTMLSIVADRKPDYLPYVLRYLEGSTYQGYNCFIMRRDLFDKLCEFEYDILFSFDERFDYSHLSKTRKRVAGYLGEILISAFVMRLEAEGLYDIDQRPLTFFMDTPAPALLAGEESAGPTLVWRYKGSSPEALAVSVRSLFSALNAVAGFEILIVANPGFPVKDAMCFIGAVPKGLNLRWAIWPVLDGLPALDERLISDDDLEAVAPFVSPWLIESKGRLIWCEGLLLFEDNPCVADDGTLLAENDILLQREMGKPDLMNLPCLNVFNGRRGDIPGTRFLSIDVETYREKLSVYHLVEMFVEEKKRALKAVADSGVIVSAELVLRIAQSEMLKRLGCSLLPFDTVSQALNIDETVRWSNDGTSKSWMLADNPKVIVFAESGQPCPSALDMHSLRFWEQARKTSAYERLLSKSLEADLRASLSNYFLTKGSISDHVLRGTRMVSRALDSFLSRRR